MSMEIYLDTCCLQRPLDDRSQPRINIEAEAVLTILGLAETGYFNLVSSEILDNEILRIPDMNRRIRAIEILNISKQYVILNEKIELKASLYIENNIKPMDALHLATAMITEVNYFCTVDDKFSKKAKQFNTVKTKVMSPLELIIEVAK